VIVDTEKLTVSCSHRGPWWRLWRQCPAFHSVPRFGGRLKQLHLPYTPEEFAEWKMAEGWQLNAQGDLCPDHAVKH